MLKENSTYKRKIKANRKFKEDTFSLAGLQKYANSVWNKHSLNPDFIQFCKDNELTKKDMLFKHVLNYATERELNKIDRKTGKVIEKKTLFSFWLFITCLQRYRKANPITITEQISKVEITEGKAKKPRKKTKKEQTAINVAA